MKILIDQNQTDARYKVSALCQTLKSRMGTGGGNVPIIIEKNEMNEEYIVRRLTPLECERLQGLPDSWTDIGEWTDSKGKKHKDSDSPRYKAIGNGIALPQWWWLFNRMKPYLGDGATLASLFDGIGSFDLLWEECYGKGTCLWVSEIEGFCVAVGKHHFGGQDG